jgi:hypothetical protein
VKWPTQKADTIANLMDLLVASVILLSAIRVWFKME